MTFLEFESFDDLQQILDDQLLIAKTNTTKQQWAIGEGDHYLSFIEIGAHLTPVFGYVLTNFETAELERAAGATDDEIDTVLAITKARAADGFRYNQAFSRITPAGEYGETHVSLMTPIAAEHFVTAKRMGWSHGHLMTQAWYHHAVTHRKR